MYTLTLELLQKCNMDCEYCYLTNKMDKVMEYDVAIKAIDHAINETNKQIDRKLHVYFIGGEPLLVFEMIKYLINYIDIIAKDNKIVTMYSTTINGTMLDENIISYFIDHNIIFKFSLDGLEKYHDLNRKDKNSNGTYMKIRDKINLIKKLDEIFNRQMGISLLLNFLFNIQIHLLH